MRLWRMSKKATRPQQSWLCLGLGDRDGGLLLASGHSLLPEYR